LADIDFVAIQSSHHPSAGRNGLVMGLCDNPLYATIVNLVISYVSYYRILDVQIIFRASFQLLILSMTIFFIKKQLSN